MSVIFSEITETTDYLLCVDHKSCGLTGSDTESQVDVIAYDDGREVSIVDYCDVHGIDGAVATVVANPVGEIVNACGMCYEEDGEVEQCSTCAREERDDFLANLARQEYKERGW